MKKYILLITICLLLAWTTSVFAAGAGLTLYIAAMKEKDKGGMVMASKSPIALKNYELKISKKNQKVYIYAVSSSDDQRYLKITDSKSGLSYGSWSAAKYVLVPNKELDWSTASAKLSKLKKMVSDIYIEVTELKKTPWFTNIVFTTGDQKADKSPINIKVMYIPDPEEIAKEKVGKEIDKAKDKVKDKIKIW
jgi:hypothetical protein